MKVKGGDVEVEREERRFVGVHAKERCGDVVFRGAGVVGGRSRSGWVRLVREDGGDSRAHKPYQSGAGIVPAQ